MASACLHMQRALDVVPHAFILVLAVSIGTPLKISWKVSELQISQVYVLTNRGDLTSDARVTML